MDYQLYQLDDCLTSGGQRMDLKLAYKQYGKLSAAKDNAILVLTSYSGTHEDAEDIFADSNLLSLSDYCVIVINMFANSLSSSPSNTPSPLDGPRFPLLTVHDNVMFQREFIEKQFGISTLELVLGFSMGGLQTFEWGAQHPDMVRAILPICGAAKVSPHNWLFLEGAKAALTADQNYAGGDYVARPEAGFEAFCKVYAGWVFSQDFYREKLYQDMGMATLDDTIAFMRNYFGRRQVNDLLSMLATWQTADISANDRYDGDFEKALGAIFAKAIVMPGETDLYFRVADSAYEVEHMPNAELRVIPSKLGHVAGSGSDPLGKVEIDRAIMDLLS